MGRAVATIATATGLFVVTNLDGLIILTALFLAAARERAQRWQIVLGQYLGFVAVLGLSLLAATGLVLVSRPWTGLLGAQPLAPGVWELVASRPVGEEGAVLLTAKLPAVVLMILANGADNLAVYAPLFATQDAASVALTMGVFLLLMALWCGLARTLGDNQRLVTGLARAGR